MLRTIDKIMESFDLEQDGLLGVEEVQHMLDKCFGKGQFDAERVMDTLKGNRRGITREELHDMFNMWARLEQRPI